jgi:UDP-glucose 4-epimerase
MTSERVLVTGAAGFIGSRLCHRLVADGFRVVGFDDLSDGSADNLADSQAVDLVVADLRDEAAVAAAAEGCARIFHQGAKRSVLRSMTDPTLYVDVNVRGTHNVLMAARESGATVVSASSSSVYGDQSEFPLRESMEPLPRSPYAGSKLAAEALCATYQRAFGVRVVSLRYFNVYGPGQDPGSEYAVVVPLFTKACLTGQRPVVHGDGEQSRDFTFIDDVLEANILASRAPSEAYGRAFNIGGGTQPTSVNRVLEIVAHYCDAAPEPIFEPVRPGDVRTTHADVTMAETVLGFRPQVSLEDGLGRTVRHMQKTLAR